MPASVGRNGPRQRERQRTQSSTVWEKWLTYPLTVCLRSLWMSAYNLRRRKKNWVLSITPCQAQRRRTKPGTLRVFTILCTETHPSASTSLSVSLTLTLCTYMWFISSEGQHAITERRSLLHQPLQSRERYFATVMQINTTCWEFFSAATLSCSVQVGLRAAREHNVGYWKIQCGCPRHAAGKLY